MIIEACIHLIKDERQQTIDSNVWVVFFIIKHSKEHGILKEEEPDG